jgi:nucleoside-diphosphate-sugar epimerase
MRVFVTGATGYVGKALVKELLSSGHSVLALARSDSGAELLTGFGAEVLRGSLSDLDVLKKGASECDAVAHLAFIHDFSDYMGSCAADRAAISAMGSALSEAGGNRALVVTSGTMMLQKGKVVTEDDGIDTKEPFSAARGASEAVALGFVDQGVRVNIVRFPPTVYGDDGFGFVSLLLGALKEKGVLAYVGEGQNRWGATHYLDIVQAFKLAIEEGNTGSVFHPVAEEGVKVKEIAEAIGQTLVVPVVSMTPEEAQEHFGMMVRSVMADNPSSSLKTRDLLGWTPMHRPLIEEIKASESLKLFGL